MGRSPELFMDALLDMYKKKYISESNFEFNLIGLEYFSDQMADCYLQEIVNKLFLPPRLQKKMQ